MSFLGKASEFFAVPGASVGSFVGDILHNVSNYACQLHYNTPGVIFDVSPFNRELWKEICKDRPSGLPPPSAASFSGGQCDAKPYKIFSTVVLADNNTPQGYTIRENGDTWAVYGAIESIAAVLVPQGVNFTLNTRVRCRGRRQNGSSFFPVGAVQDVDYGWATITGGINSRILSASFSVYTPDGSADNCGDPPPPAVVPVVLPVSQRTTNISVLSVDNSTTNDVTAIVEFPSASVDFNLSVPLRVTIDQRKFYLNIDGWHSGDPSDDSPPDLSPVQDSVLQLNGTLNQYFAPVNPSVNPSLTLIAPSFGKDSDEQKDVSGAQWLIIDLTKTPDKAQYGGDSPTVYFAGWIEFLKEGRAFPRQQINFERSIFRFPDGADGYAYTFTNGAQGNVSVYVEEAT